VTRIYTGISSYQNVDMACVAGTLELPLRKRMEKALAEKLLAAHNGNMDNIDGLIYQFYKTTIASYENGYVERAYKSVDQLILRLGEIVFASFPYELFSEMGMRIEKMSKYDNVLSLALTNGLDMETGAYFPTQEQYVRGGYEVAYATYSNVQTLREDADWSLIQGTLKNIDKL
ncbi:MAG: hypothetical protein IKV74_01930, partial [Clostridia bacterium]|nr:hypothetical protein [Clostridia bacterium]